MESTSDESDDIMEENYMADITGDGKVDSIRTVCSTSSARLVVNGKKIKSWSCSSKKQVSIQVITLSNKKSFLEICVYCAGGKNSGGLYQVKKNKLSKVLDYTSLVNLKQLVSNDFVSTNKLGSELFAYKVKENTIYLDGCFGTKSLGQISISNMPLFWNGKKFILKPTAVPAYLRRAGTLKDTFFCYIASQKIQTYKKAGSTKKAITISKNTKFYPQKLAIIKKNIYLLVRTKTGKTGWIKLGTSNKAIVKARNYRGHAG